MAIFLVYSTSGITSDKDSLSRAQNGGQFGKFWNIKHSFKLTSDMKRSSQIMTRKFFHGDYVIDDVTEWTQNFHLYSCLGEVGSANKLQGQCLVNKCKYHNCLSRLYMPKDDISEEHFSRVQVKGQHHRLIEWPWHFNGHNSVNLGIIKMKQELKCKK